jgi:acetyltransferase-like isoleucine patch superfamily enzyme
MLGKLRKIYRSKHLNELKHDLYAQALIGDMFWHGFQARIMNNTGNKNQVKIGHHSRLNGLLKCESDGKIEIGNYSSIQDGAKIYCRKEVKIGHYVGIGDGTVIMDHEMIPLKAEERVIQLSKLKDSDYRPIKIDFVPAAEEIAPVIIEDVVWVGAGCVIHKGVTIGEAAIVARNAVVLTDVPAFTIVAGNPAKVVKELEKPQKKYYTI